MVDNPKYMPLKDIGIGGIIVMRYGQTDQPEELVEPVAGKHRSYNYFSLFYSLSIVLFNLSHGS